MPNLPQRKVGVVACSGEELPGGTVTRLAALKVLEELRPAQTVTICLPLFLAGGEGDRAFAKFYPTIAIDGCEKRSAARATELYSNKPAAAIVVDEVLDGQGLPCPQGCRHPSDADRLAVDAVADAIAAEVDHLMAVRWSRSQGSILGPAEMKPAVSTAGCACGSGIPVTTVQVEGQMVQLMALEPIMELAYDQGLRADRQRPDGLLPGAPLPGVLLPLQIMETVRVYNQIPAGMDATFVAAASLAWQDYCARREAAHG